MTGSFTFMDLGGGGWAGVLRRVLVEEFPSILGCNLDSIYTPILVVEFPQHIFS